MLSKNVFFHMKKSEKRENNVYFPHYVLNKHNLLIINARKYCTTYNFSRNLSTCLNILFSLIDS